MVCADERCSSAYHNQVRTRIACLLQTGTLATILSPTQLESRFPISRHRPGHARQPRGGAGSPRARARERRAGHRSRAAAAGLGRAGRRRDGRIDFRRRRRGPVIAWRTPARPGWPRASPASARAASAGTGATAGRCRRCSAGRTGARMQWLRQFEPQGEAVHRKTRLVPVCALRCKQAALGAGPSSGGARGARGGHAVLGPAGELSRVSACWTSIRCSPIRSAPRALSYGIWARATGIRNCCRCSACPRASCPGASPPAIPSAR